MYIHFGRVDTTLGVQIRIMLTTSAENVLLKAHVTHMAFISIIDDDALVRDAVGDFVSSLGHEPFTFGSAAEFLDSERLDRTSCVITDLQMPGLTGLDLQARLLARGYRLPIIFITAYPRVAACARALDAGAIAFLIKPFDDATLESAIETALQAAGAP